MVHLFRDRKLGFIGNAIIGNATWCIERKTWQVYHNINVCDMHFNDCVYSYLNT